MCRGSFHHGESLTDVYIVKASISNSFPAHNQLPGEAKGFVSLEISFLFFLSLSAYQNVDACRWFGDLPTAV